MKVLVTSLLPSFPSRAAIAAHPEWLGTSTHNTVLDWTHSWKVEGGAHGLGTDLGMFLATSFAEVDPTGANMLGFWQIPLNGPALAGKQRGAHADIMPGVST